MTTKPVTVDASPRHLPVAPRRSEPSRLYFGAPDHYRPQPVDAPAVFLAGTIRGVPRWHDYARKCLRSANLPLVVLNPNRVDFPIARPDATWEQVNGEQPHLHLPATSTLFWFPASDRP